MYTREILPPRTSPVEDGVPVIGTWDRAFEKVDLLEIKKPYSFPLPRWAIKYNIKEWEHFNAHDDDFLLDVLFCDTKIQRFASVLFYDKKNGEYCFYKDNSTYWALPQSLCDDSVESSILDFNFRIHSCLNEGAVKLDINIDAAVRRPALAINLVYNIDNNVTPMAVSLGIKNQRILYAYKAHAPVHGEIIFKENRYSISRYNCSGFFCDYKGFLPRRMKPIFCSGMGFDENFGRFGFHIAENITRESNKNNENALWVNGKLTPLPPVLITMPQGFDKEWVIQDVEGMIDLTFTPKEQFKNAENNTSLGFFNGMLAGQDGIKIQIKNLYGTGGKLFLRM